MVNKVYWLLILVLIPLFAGCSFERNMKLDARLPMSPTVKQIPLRMGVYYSPEFIEYSRKIELIGCGPNGRQDKTGIFFIFPIGSSSRDLFDQVASSMFTTVTRTTVPPDSFEDTRSFDGVLEPRIKSFVWQMICSRDYFSTGKLEAMVSYEINLYSCPDRHLVTSLHVEGHGMEKPEICFKDCRDSIATEKAMQDAMAEFMADFYEFPEIRQWISSHGASNGNYQ